MDDGPARLSDTAEGIRGLCVVVDVFLKLKDVNACRVDEEDGNFVLSESPDNDTGRLELPGRTGFKACRARRCLVDKAFLEPNVPTEPAAMLACWLYGRFEGLTDVCGFLAGGGKGIGWTLGSGFDTEISSGEGVNKNSTGGPSSPLYSAMV